MKFSVFFAALSIAGNLSAQSSLSQKAPPLRVSSRIDSARGTTAAGAKPTPHEAPPKGSAAFQFTSRSAVVSAAEFAFSPRVAWSPNDPADSLYRIAVSNLTRGEYRHAAEVFTRIVQSFPASDYAPDAYYYRAMALYRMGGTGNLQQALTSLDTLSVRFNGRGSQTDVGALRTRILGNLAVQGDATARMRVERAALKATPSCDRDDVAVKLEALNALSAMNADSAAPALRMLMGRREECLSALRRSALLLVSKQSIDEQAAIFADVVRNDPVPSLRQEALTWFGKLPYAKTIATFEEILRSSRESTLHDQVVRYLSAYDNDRARGAIREAIESPHISASTRVKAIRALQRSVSASDAAFLNALYRNLDERTLRILAADSVISASRSAGTNTSPQSINANLIIAKDRSETIARRAIAIRNTRSAQVAIAEIIGLYDSIDEPQLRGQIIEVLGERAEATATDKLIAIVRDSSDNAGARRAAISALAKKDDPRSQRLLLEIISK